MLSGFECIVKWMHAVLETLMSWSCFFFFLFTETRMTAMGIIYMKKKSQTPSEQPEEEPPAAKKAKTEPL